MYHLFVITDHDHAEQHIASARDHMPRGHAGVCHVCRTSNPATLKAAKQLVDGITQDAGILVVYPRGAGEKGSFAARLLTYIFARNKAQGVVRTVRSLVV